MRLTVDDKGCLVENKIYLSGSFSSIHVWSSAFFGVCFLVRKVNNPFVENKGANVSIPYVDCRIWTSYPSIEMIQVFDLYLQVFLWCFLIQSYFSVALGFWEWVSLLARKKKKKKKKKKKGDASRVSSVGDIYVVTFLRSKYSFSFKVFNAYVYLMFGSFICC